MSRSLSFAELTNALSQQKQTSCAGGFQPIERLTLASPAPFSPLAIDEPTGVVPSAAPAPRHFIPSEETARARAALPQPGDEDPIRQAWKAGFDDGVATERRLAAEQNSAEAEAIAQLRSEIVRINQESLRSLEARMRDAVLALCRQVIDEHVDVPERLAQRVHAAASLLDTSDERLVVETSEADHALLVAALGSEWDVIANHRLTRGSIRVLSRDGGVEDGPSQWKRALEEAIRQC